MADFPIPASPTLAGAIKRVSRNEIPAATLLLISKEPAAFHGLRSIGQVYSWQLKTVSCGMEALECLESGFSPDVVLLDVPPGDVDNLHTVRRLRRLRPSLPVLLLCTEDDRRNFMQAPEVHPEDCLAKPWHAGDLERALNRQMYRAEMHSSITSRPANEIEPLGNDLFFVSASPVMRALRARAEMVAEMDVPVVIAGEEGSGREITARLIHKLSVRSPFPFCKTNCAALPLDLLSRELLGYESSSARGIPEIKSGKLEAANNGTLLLEELESVPEALLAQLLPKQGQFLRLAGAIPVRTDVRLLATITSAANEDGAGRQKRLDVSRRFSKYVLEVPPLRDRVEDVPLLLGNFLTRLAKKYGLPLRQVSSRALDACQRHSWPGNLRELENFVKRYLIMGDDSLEMDDLERPANWHGESLSHRLDAEVAASPASRANDTSLKSLVRTAKGEAEKNAITHALEETRWNRKAAARLLGISYRALLYKIQEYRMAPPDPSVVVFQNRVKVGNET